MHIVDYGSEMGWVQLKWFGMRINSACHKISNFLHCLINNMKIFVCLFKLDLKPMFICVIKENVNVLYSW